MVDLRIRVEGLREAQRALRALGGEAPKQLRITQNEVADLLIARIRPRVPRRSGAARSAFKASSTRTATRITVGGRKAPYLPWLDFGGRTGIRRSVRRDFLKEGRYVYPTLQDNRTEIEAALGEGLNRVIRAAGLDGS